MVTTRGGAKSGAPPARRLPMLLWAPNLIGYVRVITLILAMREADPGSNLAIYYLTTSLLLDYIDGPCARWLDQCSQFGDLLDHYTDHITMMWLVYLTAASSTLGRVDLAVSAFHNGMVCLYMLYNGHYMKHTKHGNAITRAIEANNFWNFPSLLYCGNCILFPLVKLSYASTLSIRPVAAATTPLVDFFCSLGAISTLAYTVGFLADASHSLTAKKAS